MQLAITVVALGEPGTPATCCTSADGTMAAVRTDARHNGETLTLRLTTPP